MKLIPSKAFFSPIGRRVEASDWTRAVTKNAVLSHPLSALGKQLHMVDAPIDHIDNAVDVDWKNLLSWLETFDSDITKNLCVYSKQVPGKEQEEGFEPDPTYGPYLAMFPSDFAGHPLSWLILGTHQTLLDYMPPSVKRDVHKVASRFEKDWAAVSRYIDYLSGKHSTFIPSSYTLWSRTANQETKSERYLWAWLNVDLANHSSLKHQTTDKTPFPTFYSPLQTTLQAGDQIYLKYGSHSNSTLFTEYGFIEKGYPNGGQVDVQDMIEDQFRVLGDLGDWMESLLKNFNFWGDWVLYDSPPPASPSYRLLPALRLLKLSDTFPPNIVKANDPFSFSADLHVWRDTIYGEQDVVSMSNEDAVWHFLLSICDSVKSRAEKGLKNLKGLEFEGNPPGWYAYAVECVEQLWLEELQVAEAVAQAVKSGFKQ
ncbi:hypothetical protein Clacol_006645 [Clathrus columnatus]|uniref:SET domain-containing protein n=1 Tax=Clathrus columnatus TaxID=1419009 RepID=A0AAV5AI84_9AGAM|nr:hypothetical protein Clacol_006645 [Clathrus columnatus]